MARTWRSRPDRVDAPIPEDEFWWFGDLIKHRHYPFHDENRDKAEISFTLHNAGLAAPVDESLSALQAFHERGINLCLTGETSTRAAGLRDDLDSIELGPVTTNDPLPGQHRMVHLRNSRYGCSAWVPDETYLKSKLAIDETAAMRRVRDVWPWLNAHESIGHHAFITRDHDLLNVRHQLDGSHRFWILSPDEALDYVDAVLRQRRNYRIASFSHDTRHGYYELRVQDLVPYAHSLLGTASRMTRPSDVMAFTRSLLGRVQFALEAHNRIGEYYYQPADLDTNDAALYHLNYLLILSTSILDNLAWLVSETYAMKFKDLMHISLHPGKGLRTRLKDEQSILAGVLEDSDQLIRLLYPARHNVAHRFLAWSIGYFDERSMNGIGLMEVTDEFATGLKEIDNAEGHFYSRWGHRRIGDLDVIEPYRFSRQTVVAVSALADRVSKHLIEALSGSPAMALPDQEPWRKFTIPFPRAIA